jgi:hypothetical protein
LHLGIWHVIHTYVPKATYIETVDQPILR